MKILITFLTMTFGLILHAQSADEFKVLFTCKQVTGPADHGLVLQVLTDQTTGLSEIQLTNKTSSGPVSSTRMVEQLQYRCGGHFSEAPSARCLGAPLVFQGADIQLKVQTPAPPNEQGRRKGILTLVTAEGQEPQRVPLDCGSLAN